jgi:hypothetical protein
MSGPNRISAELAAELDDAEAKAWDALARYKFWMFGYWAAIWVHLNRIGHFKRPNPWLQLVKFARDHLARLRQAAPGRTSNSPLFEQDEAA